MDNFNPDVEDYFSPSPKNLLLTWACILLFLGILLVAMLMEPHHP